MIPVIMQIVYLYLNYRGDWYVLVTGYLIAPAWDDKTTDAGSVMLEQLRQEMETSQRFDQ
jgi:hypothetical protein